MSASDWETKYSVVPETWESDGDKLIGFNWETVMCLSSSTLSTESTNLCRLSLTVKDEEGLEKNINLELTATELKEALDSMSDTLSSLSAADV